ncbi:MAG: BREX system Lon protease-like protein BrxL [Oscillospiraceae bacterium]|nr:BREX system Lon protease-like protein BrxL [Oscillospiraceae bacterium]
MDKLREYFDEMVVYKDLKKSSAISSLGLPSFLRDWLLKRFSDDDGELDTEELADFAKSYLPSREEWTQIKDRIITDNERVKILTKITVDISIKTGEITFELPNFGLTNKETMIDNDVWETCREDLVNGQEVWGVVELGYRPPDETVKPKLSGKIRLTNFTSFCPYSVDLDYYKDVRSEFTISEWIDILLGAIDYNASGYKTESQKLTMLTRLLPFIEKNLNLIELAPKGTGKSYVFGRIGKYGMLTGGGMVTRARMFYDMSKKTPGFVMGHDFVAIDEVKLVQFGNTDEMRSALQEYMENNGNINVSGFEGHSDAGIVFLGNIDQERMDEYQNMFSELPALFQESALLDRIHGFIKGWDIPAMSDDLKVSGWALNSEYFCTILHELRNDVTYRTIVDQIVEVRSPNPYVRHTEAVKRIATAFLKLLFPNVRCAQDVDLREFNRYCLRPAVQMRSIILKQLCMIDKSYKDADRNMPEFALRKDKNAN